MEAHGQFTQGTNFHNPRTTYKRSKNVFAVTCIALIVVHSITELLQLSLLSLTGFEKPPDLINHYFPLQVNKSEKIILLILLYKYLKSYSGYFDFRESDPLHKIMRYWFSISLGFPFPSHTLVLLKCFVPQLYQFRMGISEGPARKYF